ncbi:MAG: phosphoribosylglycinamide formyltransferase [Nitrospirae bacterium]|nr:phosphoribosylglycinamide formyltransferase [Nitrospirota bacterium]
MSNPPLRLGVLVSGRGSNLEAIIHAGPSVQMNATVAVVISDRAQSQALEHARRSQIPAIHLNPKTHASREDYDTEVVRLLREHRADLVVLAGYMRLITSRLIEPYRNRIINIHPSLLPSFPGLHAHRQALEWGVRISGCTVHFVNEAMDQGPIIIQAAVPVLDGDTEEMLEARVLEQEHRILPQAIQFLAEDRLEISGRRVVLRSPKPTAGMKVVSPMIELGFNQ